MGKSGLQFLATGQEITTFVASLRANAEVTIAVADLESPDKLSILQEDLIPDQISRCSFIYVKLGASFEKTNSLRICVGQDDEACIRESSMGINGEGDEFAYWKKQISKFRRTLSKGAYVVNPHRNCKTYYKNVYYTAGAKEAFENGVQLQPIAGWNYYLLEEA